MPSRIDDELVAATCVLDVGRSSFRVSHIVNRGAEVLAKVVLTHVAIVTVSRRPVPVPWWAVDNVGPAH